MSRVITIDPGISKCGVIIADIKEKKVYEAVVIKSHLLLKYVKKKYQNGKNVQLLIGNGTSSKNYIKYLNQFEPDLIIAEEKNSTYRAKQRYFDIFPFAHFNPLIESTENQSINCSLKKLKAFRSSWKRCPVSSQQFECIIET